MIAVVNLFMRIVPVYSPISSAPPTAPYRSSVTPDVDGTVRKGELTLHSAADVLNTSLAVSLVVLLAVIVSGAAISWVLAGRLLRPLHLINAAARAAGNGRFDHRVALNGPQDEVKDLSDTFDDMLSKVGRSFEAQRRFAANASHELRTPLATTRTLLEVTLADPLATIEDYRTVAKRLLDTNLRHSEMVEALLDLARADGQVVSCDLIDVAELVADALAPRQDEIEGGRLRVRVELPPWTPHAVGDRVLIRQAIGNLVSNAVRHNRPGGEVRISLARSDAGVILRISNDGEQISAERAQELCEPFTRGRDRVRRSGHPDGHGLGLALVAAIADANGARLEVRTRRKGGLDISLTLRSRSSPETPASARRDT
ncbi:sensor histidine kinase [Microbacterium sp. NPDC089695]|uniref:sensor histidine kinase n=1 Tax=Microbacterium sp. NPDC089695 TaxID=3364198 RepID=UPI003810D764